jgi:hypothetical protein
VIRWWPMGRGWHARSRSHPRRSWLVLGLEVAAALVALTVLRDVLFWVWADSLA